jgi:hypothetical protein
MECRSYQESDFLSRHLRERELRRLDIAPQICSGSSGAGSRTGASGFSGGLGGSNLNLKDIVCSAR